jgi:cytochrome P450
VSIPNRLREEFPRLNTILRHESTAITLAWGLFKLAQMPDVQEHLRQEIQETLPDLNSEAPSYETINSMPYLRCFLMELLRLYPAFPAIMREASKTTNVEDLQIQQGTRIMVSPYAINRSLELWGPDAREFRVERWLDSHSGGAKSPQAFMTFSSGQRICIGKDFAVNSLKLFLAVMVNNFRFEEAVPGWHPPIQKGTSLKPIGLKVKISELK